MDQEQKKEYLKERLTDYLEEKNINIRKNFNCLAPDHDDLNPSMAYDRKRNKVHCFSCKADYDIFNLIEIDYGLTDYQSQFNKACELYGLEFEKEHTPKTKPVKRQENACKNEQTNKDNSSYYDACVANVHLTDYFQKRGLNQQTIKEFNLGYDPQKNKVIIPVSHNYYVERDMKENNKRNFQNQDGVSVDIFNIKALRNRNKAIFVVESTFCALSVIQSGGQAIALNGVGQINKLIKTVKEHKEKLEGLKLIISLDNDKSGKEAAYTLMTHLKELNIQAIIYNLSDEHKDPNELLVADASRLKANVADAQQEFDRYLAELQAKQEEEAQRVKDEYQAKSALGHLQGFINDIATVNTNYIPTGFTELDNVLGGGMFECLYFIGALSSLGKTTFTLQMADQVAQQGHDVLIISLEMARNELMAKSISRNTFLVNSNHAKTTRGITTAAYYKYYSDDDRACINQAINDYAKYAGHIYIEESVGNTTVEEVKRLVEQHIQVTGNKPLVIIDYVQILRPLDPRMSDKQAVDHNVMELKRISREFKIPVIGISSLNRMSYKEKISMTAFKESGAIEYSSDVLIGLQLAGAGEQGFDVDIAKRRDPRLIELVVLKNRNGSTGVKIGYTFIAKFNIFDEDGVVD